MSSGLLALLDDVAALVKAGAASLDDVPAQIAKTGTKVSGIVIDDAAVTPKYVVGLDPARELVIIWHIARASIINKLFILGPAVLVLGYFAPWTITPLLMLGGTFLCFEGFEKVHQIFSGKSEDEDSDNLEEITPEELEKLRINSAVRTDFILSAEIVAITYSTVAQATMMNQIVVVAIVATLITVLVYGSVAILVKMDDIGLYLTKNGGSDGVRNLGRGIVKMMPGALKGLSYIGTAAMLLVGAEIIAHGIPPLHHGLEALGQKFQGQGLLGFLVKAVILIFGGLIWGGIVEKLLHLLPGKSKSESAANSSQQEGISGTQSEQEESGSGEISGEVSASEESSEKE